MRNQWLPALSLLGIGFYIAAAIIFGALGGLWLDDKLGTRPLWLIGGFIAGIAAAVGGVYAMVKPFIRDNKEDKDSK